MCESICPVDAIRYYDEVEEETEIPFIALNDAAFRDADGSIIEPGGWKKGDPPVSDPPQLETLFPKKDEVA